MPTDLDHTSFAVHDAVDWGIRLRAELGAEPVAGEAGADFRWLQLRVADGGSGATMELLDAVGDGFLSRFLARHGEGPHHITFMVDDLRAAAQRVQAAGFTITGESYDDPVWQEAFVAPDAVHGTVIQLAATDGTVFGVPEWAEPVARTPVTGRARLGATHLGSTDLDRTRELFGGALDADVEVGSEGSLILTWPSGTVLVRPRDVAGVIGMDLQTSDGRVVTIGSVPLGPAE